ncbi:hypothetical protein C0991_001809 [Blastosporella zonata]|nr:hypothetical protein C0991_001809 [Blastosporella zonata]
MSEDNENEQQMVEQLLYYERNVAELRQQVDRLTGEYACARQEVENVNQSREELVCALYHPDGETDKSRQGQSRSWA